MQLVAFAGELEGSAVHRPCVRPCNACTPAKGDIYVGSCRCQISHWDKVGRGGWTVAVGGRRSWMWSEIDVLDRAFAAIGGYEHTRTRKSKDRAEIMFSKIERLAIRIPSDSESPGVGINTESPSRD